MANPEDPTPDHHTKAQAKKLAQQPAPYALVLAALGYLGLDPIRATLADIARKQEVQSTQQADLKIAVASLAASQEAKGVVQDQKIGGLDERMKRIEASVAALPRLEEQVDQLRRENEKRESR